MAQVRGRVVAQLWQHGIEQRMTCTAAPLSPVPRGLPPSTTCDTRTHLLETPPTNHHHNRCHFLNLSLCIKTCSQTGPNEHTTIASPHGPTRFHPLSVFPSLPRRNCRFQLPARSSPALPSTTCPMSTNDSTALLTSTCMCPKIYT